jgi:glutathione S-transferase
MAITLYDLTANDSAVRFSPFCWSTKMALLHKGLEFESVPWLFTDKSATADSGYTTVPVIKHEGKWVGDSWNIAQYLDETFPEKPTLIGGPEEKAQVEEMLEVCSNQVFPAIVPIIIKQVHSILSEPCQVYFRETREARLEAKLEDVSASPEDGVKNLASALESLETKLADKPYFGGDAPSYADYILFGTLKIADVVSQYAPLDRASVIGKWFDSIQALYDGYAAKAKTVRS